MYDLLGREEHCKDEVAGLMGSSRPSERLSAFDRFCVEVSIAASLRRCATSPRSGVRL